MNHQGDSLPLQMGLEPWSIGFAVQRSKVIHGQYVLQGNIYSNIAIFTHKGFQVLLIHRTCDLLNHK